MVDIKARTSIDTQKLQQLPHDSSSATAAAGPDLHMMGLGLSSPSMEWNQNLL